MFYQSIPDLGGVVPGPILGALLSAIDVDTVSPHDRIEVMRAEQRMESYFSARKYRSMTSVVDGMGIDDPRWATEAAAVEIQCALHLTRNATEQELSFAQDLQQRLPAVWEALLIGRIDVPRARTIARGTEHLSAGVAQGAVERIIDAAPELTTGQLRARLERVVIEADPHAARERYEQRVEDRRLVTESTPDGTANLHGFDLPPHRVTAVSRKVNGLARSLKTADETRTMDQLRADVLVDLLLGERDTSTGGVHIRTDLETLAALSEHPGELEGHGPVIADIARQVAKEHEDAEWRWSVTDPATGELVYDGVTRRRPTQALRRTVEARDPTCAFPGCRMPSVDCDYDHLERWADGGATTQDNGAPGCARHNRVVREQHGWTYQRLPNGTYRWTSRLGHTYHTIRNRSP